MYRDFSEAALGSLIYMVGSVRQITKQDQSGLDGLHSVELSRG